MRSHVPVAVSLTSPLSESTAYNGGLPSRCSQICFNVTQPPRELLSADSRYSRSDVEENRIDTVLLESQPGLAMALFGEEVSAAPAILKASKLRTAVFRTVRVIASCAALLVAGSFRLSAVVVNEGCVWARCSASCQLCRSVGG